MANLRRPTWDCQIWILGGSDMDSGHSPDIKCASLASRFPFLFNILYHICISIGILPKIAGKYIKKPPSYPPMGGGGVISE